MRTSRRIILIAGLALTTLASCGGFEQVMKSKDYDLKLRKANEYFDKKQWSKSNQLLEEAIKVFKGTKQFEELYYKYAMTFYNMKDWPSASLYLKGFVDVFPNSKNAEECDYLYAMCLYKMSPKFELDQTNTYKAVGALQAFMNMHPNSVKIAEANKLIDNCRIKLEEKEASAARLYFNIEQFKAASIAYTEVIRKFPESPIADYYKYMIIRSQFRYAEKSVKDKQEERFAAVTDSYQDLLRSFPNSKYVKDAEKYFTLTQNSIKQLRNEQK